MQAELGELGKWVVSVAYSSYHFVVVSSYLPFPPPNPSQHSPNSRRPLTGTHKHTSCLRPKIGTFALYMQ